MVPVIHPMILSFFGTTTNTLLAPRLPTSRLHYTALLLGYGNTCCMECQISIFCTQNLYVM